VGWSVNGGKFDMVPLGGDWSMPFSASQANQFWNITNSSWTNSGLLFGYYQINLFPAMWAAALIRWFGLPFIFLVTLAIVYFSFLTLARALNLVSNFSAVVGFFVFTFSALFFDYFVMGWLFVLIAASLMPLAVASYLRALDGSNIHIVMAGLMFALSAIQSQAILWFLIVFLTISLASIWAGKDWRRNITVLAGTSIIFFVCNAYWVPALILYPPSLAANSDLLTSDVSLGTFANFNFLNAVRSWGGLYNFQFETIIKKHGGELFSFLVPTLALIGLLRFPSRHKWVFACLMAFPLVIFYLNINRNLLEHIPFSNVIRDLSRFIVVSHLGTSVLAMMGSEVVLSWWGPRKKSLVGLTLFILLIGAAYPWWSGLMLDWRDSNGRDIRLRTFSPPASWTLLEQKLSLEQLDQKALFYPVGGTVSIRMDPRFNGAFHEVADVFGGLSPVPGIISVNDRKFGLTDNFVQGIANDYPSAEQLSSLSELGVRLFIFRNDLIGPYPQPSKELIQLMLHSGRWQEWFKNDLIEVYAATDFKPIIYAEPAGECGRVAPQLEYRRINTTLYRLRIHNASCKFTLLLNETFHENWHLTEDPNLTWVETGEYVVKPLLVGDLSPATFLNLKEDQNTGRITIPNDKRSLEFISLQRHESIQNNNLPTPSLQALLAAKDVAAIHLVGNGLVNAWEIDPTVKNVKAGNQSIDLFIEFIPQRVYLIGRWIAGSAYLLIFILILRYYYIQFRQRRQTE
jgi:hypothetical protein